MSMLTHEKQIAEYEETLEKVKKNPSLWSSEEVSKFEKKLEKLKKKVYSSLSAWDRVTICRHPSRPHGIDFLRNLCEEFTELCGDRLYGNDPAVICGLGKIGQEKFMILAQEKGADTESRVQRNFGMPHPEGYRKALRCMKLAERFQLPVLCLLDTPGAFPGLSAEERGQGWAIAENLRAMSNLQVPIIVVLIGEGCSGGALGMGVGDVIGMLEHSYYSVISPEGCSAILWKDAKRNAEAAAALKMHPEDLIQFDIIDEIIQEPLGGAHHDPAAVYQRVRCFILEQLKKLSTRSLADLLEARYQKFRKMGGCAVMEGS